jgi:hypothetical protein
MNEPQPPEPGLADRWIVAIFYAVVLGFFIELIIARWWWELPIVAVLAFFTFVLYRNRRRRAAR